MPVWASVKYINTSNANRRQRIENRVIDRVYKVPEVRAQVAGFDKQTKGKRNMQFMIAERPSANFNYYWVNVMEDNEFNYATDYHLMVDPKSRVVKFYDVVNDTIIDLVTWRKKNKK